MASVRIYPGDVLNPIDRRILGHFVEQFPGNIPGGIYDPSHPLADEDGFRKDLLDAMRDVKVPQIRWAGNFSSSYHWMDGVGPKELRPRKINAAWNAVEDNGHGTAEFVKLCRKVNAKPVIGVNMGSGTPEEAMNWVEYCNGTRDTFYANLRRSHGHPEPFGVKHWCLGNEMYAAWQFGRMDALEYAEHAEHFSTAMRLADPSIHLTAVGLETDPDWNVTVVRRLSMEKTRFSPGKWIDALSAHYYPIGCAGAFEGASYETRMALSAFFHERTMLMRSAIEVAANDAESDIAIAWDEWNPMGDRDGTEFTLEMALWTASILNSFIRDSKYVKIANYTFFIGGNGPVQLTERGVTFHADYHLLKLYGELLGSQLIESRTELPRITVQMPMDNRWPVVGQPASHERAIPVIDLVATGDENGRVVLFATNMDAAQDCSLEVTLCETPKSYEQATFHVLWNPALNAQNSIANPDMIRFRKEDIDCRENKARVVLPRHSVCALELLPGT